jgi:hypothetical protein
MFARQEERGLGVKNLEAFNIIVSSKWKWRLLNNRGSILHDLLEHMYAPFSCKLLCWDLREILTVLNWPWRRDKILEG